MITDFLHHLQLFELGSMTLLLGVLVSTGILRYCGVNPGGIMGAAFTVLAASDSIWWALSLLVVAGLISWLYDQLFSDVYAGREPIFVMALMSVGLSVGVGLLLEHFHIMTREAIDFPFGIILPAIVAAAIRKQGMVLTYRFLALAIILTLEAVIVAYNIGLWFDYDFTALAGLNVGRQDIELNWSETFAFISVLIGTVLYWRYRVKSAGFIILPMLAALAIVSPINFGILLVTGAVVFGLSSFIQRYTLIIGTSRYAVVLTLSVAFVWTLTYLLLHTTHGFAPYMGNALFAVLAITVLVNDHNIYGVSRTMPLFFVGLAIMACVEVGGAYVVGHLKHDKNPPRFYTILQETPPK